MTPSATFAGASAAPPLPAAALLQLFLNATASSASAFDSSTPLPLAAQQPSAQTPTATPHSSVLHMRLALTVTHLLLVSLGTVNLLVIFVILLRPYMRSITNVYMISLCLADFIYLTNLTLVAATQINDKSWPFSSALCTMYHGTETTGKYASVMFVVLLAVDRYCAMCKSNWCARYRNYRTAVLISLAAWLFAALAASPLYYFAEVALLRIRSSPGNGNPSAAAGADRQVHKLCIAKWPNSDIARWYITASSVLIFALPLAVIIFCYYHILNKLREALKSCKRMKRGASSRAPYHRVTRLVLWVVVFHVLSWSPFWLFNLFSSIFRLRISTQFDRIVVNIIHLFPYVNCALNPILYVAHAENFRVAFRSLFCGKLFASRRRSELFEDSRCVVPGAVAGANGCTLGTAGGVPSGPSSVMANGSGGGLLLHSGNGAPYRGFMMRGSSGSERMLLSSPSTQHGGAGAYNNGAAMLVGSAPSLLPCSGGPLTMRANSAKHSVITLDDRPAGTVSTTPIKNSVVSNYSGRREQRRGSSMCEQAMVCGAGVAAANVTPFISRVILEESSKRASLEKSLLAEINTAEQMPQPQEEKRTELCFYTMGMAASTIGVAAPATGADSDAPLEEAEGDEFV